MNSNKYRPPWLTQDRIDAFRREYQSQSRRELCRQREEARNSPDYIEAMRILAKDIEGPTMEEILLQELDDALKRLLMLTPTSRYVQLRTGDRR